MYTTEGQCIMQGMGKEGRYYRPLSFPTCHLTDFYSILFTGQSLTLTEKQNLHVVDYHSGLSALHAKHGIPTVPGFCPLF